MYFFFNSNKVKHAKFNENERINKLKKGKKYISDFEEKEKYISYLYK